MILNLYGGLGIDLSILDSSAAKILSGSKYIGSNGTVITGTMTNNGGGTTTTLTRSVTSKTIASGYWSSQNVINVSSESLSAYTSKIPILVLSDSETTVTTKVISSSSNKFITTVTGVPDRIRVGVLNSNSSVLTGAYDITDVVGGSYILPGKSIGIKYGAGSSDYTSKVDSTLSYETKPATSSPITFTNSTNLLTTTSVTPTDSSKILSEVTYVPTSISFTTSSTIPSGASFVTSSSAIVKGQYGILSIKSGSNSIQQGYFSGTYEAPAPTLETKSYPTVTYTTTMTSAASTNISYNSASYAGLNVVNYCPTTISFTTTDSPPSTASQLATSNNIVSGAYAIIGVKSGSSITYKTIKGTYTYTVPTETKACPKLSSYKSDNHTDSNLTETSITPTSGKYLTEVTGIPSSMTVDWVLPTSAAWSNLTGTKVKIGTSTHLGSTYLIVRMKIGGTIYNYYVTPD